MSSVENDPDFLQKIIKLQTRLTAADFNLSKYMSLIADEMYALTSATGTVVELIEEDEMVYRAATGTVKNYLGLRLPKSGSISGLCISSNEILYSEDTENDPRVNVNACRLIKARSLVVAPLMYHDKAVGVLKILSNIPHAFNEHHIQILKLMAGFIAAGLSHQISFAVNNEKLNKHSEHLSRLKNENNDLYYLANFDFLTDLANRKLFKESLITVLSQAKVTHSLVCLMYLDIDHFKEINDNYGHDTGDALLVAFSARLKKSVRSNDLIARLGGDEFAILLDDIKEELNATRIADKILKLMQQNFNCNNHILKVSTSIGLAFYRGEEITEDELIKEADMALYKSKQAGRKRYHIYDKNNIDNA